MREVLGLRELGGEDDEPGEVVARGEAVAAAGVVIALFVGVGYMLTLGRPPGAERPSVVEAPAAVPVSELVEDAARAALDAWARFADSGDVDHLEAVFDPGGPQFARLRTEAPGLAASPAAGAPYAFTATAMQVGAGSYEDERVVVADVVVSKVGEADRRFAWELVMRTSEGRWRLWTVRERADLDGAGPGGRP